MTFHLYCLQPQFICSPPALVLEQGTPSAQTSKCKQKPIGGALSNRRASKKSKPKPYMLPVQQANFIKDKLWDNVLSSLRDERHQIFLGKGKEVFQSICCQELVFWPITTVCQQCLQGLPG